MGSAMMASFSGLSRCRWHCRRFAWSSATCGTLSLDPRCWVGLRSANHAGQRDPSHRRRRGGLTMKLSDIKSSEAELQDYYAQLRSQHITPAWTGGGITREPKSKAVPWVWHWRDLRPQAMQAAQLVGTEQAERRVLRLTHPELPGLSASNTMVAHIQIVMPGEIARAHRHSPSALRLIIEGTGGYTVVNGERIPMHPGDLVLTPNWTWHDHANDTDAPMIWLDGLDTPLVRMLEAGFYEEYHKETQTIVEGAGSPFAKYGEGGLRPVWEAEPATRYSPLWHHPTFPARAAPA